MAGRLISSRPRGYPEELVPPQPAELQTREDCSRAEKFPITGPAAGHVCYQIACMVGARCIFELGSGYGYSTARANRTVKENGGETVYHVVWDKALSLWARGHLCALDLDGVVHHIVGEAVELLRETPGPFDLVFNDINKECYPESLPVITRKLRPGGVLMVDNMFWYGRVFDQADRSPSIQGVRELTPRLKDDLGWIVCVVPIGDEQAVAYER